MKLENGVHHLEVTNLALEMGLFDVTSRTILWVSPFFAILLFATTVHPLVNLDRLVPLLLVSKTQPVVLQPGVTDFFDAIANRLALILHMLLLPVPAPTYAQKQQLIQVHRLGVQKHC